MLAQNGTRVVRTLKFAVEQAKASQRIEEQAAKRNGTLKFDRDQAVADASNPELRMALHVDDNGRTTWSK